MAGVILLIWVAYRAFQRSCAYVSEILGTGTTAPILVYIGRNEIPLSGANPPEPRTRYVPTLLENYYMGTLLDG